MSGTLIATRTKPNVRRTDAWCTAKWFADAIGPVDLDPCSNPSSAIDARVTMSIEQGRDGLAQPWLTLVRIGSFVFVNPPFSCVMPWALRSVEAARCGLRVMLLLKYDPTTDWWRCLFRHKGARAYPLRRRMRFRGAPGVAPWPCVVICLGMKLPAKLLPHVVGELRPMPWAGSSKGIRAGRRRTKPRKY